MIQYLLYTMIFKNKYYMMVFYKIKLYYSTISKDMILSHIMILFYIIWYCIYVLLYYTVSYDTISHKDHIIPYIWHNIILHRTHCIILHHIVQNIIKRSYKFVIFHNTIYETISYYMVQYCSKLSGSILYLTIWYIIIPYDVISYITISNHSIQYCIISYNIIFKIYDTACWRPFLSVVVLFFIILVRIF